jgi:hypothetical protein
MVVSTRARSAATPSRPSAGRAFFRARGPRPARPCSSRSSSWSPRARGSAKARARSRHVVDGRVEHRLDLALGVGGAVGHALGQAQEPQHDRQGQGRVQLGQPPGDQGALHVELAYELLVLAPVDAGPAVGDGVDALGQFGGQVLGADLAGQLQAQPPLDLGVALGDVDQQFGQPLGAQGGQIGRRQGLSRSRTLHRRQRSSPVRARSSAPSRRDPRSFSTTDRRHDGPGAVRVACVISATDHKRLSFQWAPQGTRCRRPC